MSSPLEACRHQFENNKPMTSRMSVINLQPCPPPPPTNPLTSDGTGSISEQNTPSPHSSFHHFLSFRFMLLWSKCVGDNRKGPWTTENHHQPFFLRGFLKKFLFLSNVAVFSDSFANCGHVLASGVSALSPAACLDRQTCDNKR